MRVSDIDVEVCLREVDLGCGCGFAMVFDFSVAFWLMNFTLEVYPPPHLFSCRPSRNPTSQSSICHLPKS